MKKIQSYKIPILISVILHIFIFSLLFLHFSPTRVQSNEVKIVQAVAINETQLSTAKPRALQSEPQISKVPIVPEEAIRRIEQVALKQPEVAKAPISKPLPTPLEPTPLKEKTATDQEELALLQEPKFEDKTALKKKEEEKKRKAESKKKEEQLAKKLRAEKAKQLQQKLAEEAKRIELEAEEKSYAEPSTATRQKEIETEDLAGQLEAEKKQLTASQQKAENGEVDKYKQMIIQTISRRWLIPETDNKELNCQLAVHLGPGGVVLSVDVIKESGDDNLDRSARTAIMKASPLPVPENSDLFDNFRLLRLTFRPQGIVSG